MKSKKKKIEKYINIMLDVLIFICGFILLVSVYTGVQSKILGNDYTDFFGYSMFEVQTGSMADTINAGDWIIVKLTSKVKLNDIVTYRLSSEYVTHRIVEVYNGTYITKGDANSAKDDQPVDQSQIVGKVVRILPNFGIIKKTLFNISVLIALIITLLLFNLAFKKDKIKTKKMKETTYHPLLVTITNKFKLVVEKIKVFINQKQNKEDNTLNEEPKVKTYEPTFNYNQFKHEYKENPDLEKTALYRVVSVDTDPQKEIAETNNEQAKEDDLEKTALYRVVSVDKDTANETNESNTDSEDQVIIEPATEEELEKTALYRVISVDAEEIDNTLLEIAQTELKEAEQKDKKEEEIEVEPVQTENDDEDDDSITRIELDLVKNKRGKNIIDTVMNIKKEELNELIDAMIKHDKTYSKETRIKEVFITTYVDAKYYNYYGDKEINYSGKSLTLKIQKIIKETANELIKDYRGKDMKHDDIVDAYTNVFLIIASLEQGRDSITELKVRNEFYKKEIMKYFDELDDKQVELLVDEIREIQKYYADIIDYFIKKLETDMFNLILNKLTTRNNMYGLVLEHNIAFSKVYSEYIIDKIYTEGIIAEDKMSVLLTLLSVQLIKDMLMAKFDQKYILYLPETLYTKERKFKGLLRMIDDEYAKNNVIILIAFADLLKNKAIVKEIRRMGYRFAIVFDKTVEIADKDRGNIYIADYVFINKKVIDIAKILPSIPEELLDSVIYEDIIEKVGYLGSE